MQGSIQNIDNTSFLEISSASDALGKWAEARTLGAKNSGTGGLEIYFVDDIIDAAGLHIPAAAGAAAGILIDDSAPLKAFAHELGHACGWPDIYVDLPVSPTLPAGANLPTDKVKVAWLPDDWNNGSDAKYYDNNSQRTIVERLLMHGHGGGSDDSIAIPRGEVHGLSSSGAAVNLSVGLATMNRDPQNP